MGFAGKLGVFTVSACFCLRRHSENIRLAQKNVEKQEHLLCEGPSPPPPSHSSHLPACPVQKHEKERTSAHLYCSVLLVLIHYQVNTGPVLPIPIL